MNVKNKKAFDSFEVGQEAHSHLYTSFGELSNNNEEETPVVEEGVLQSAATIVEGEEWLKVNTTHHKIEEGNIQDNIENSESKSVNSGNSNTNSKSNENAEMESTCSEGKDENNENMELDDKCDNEQSEENAYEELDDDIRSERDETEDKGILSCTDVLDDSLHMQIRTYVNSLDEFVDDLVMIKQKITIAHNFSIDGDNKLRTSLKIQETSTPWMSESERRTIYQFMKRQPLIVVMGSNGSGKSSLINTLLGERVLPERGHMPQKYKKGLVCLKHAGIGKTPQITLACASTSVQMPMSMTEEDCKQIPEMIDKYVQEKLNDEEKQQWCEFDDVYLKVETNSAFLTSGVQIMEVPDVTAAMREKVLTEVNRSLLPCIIYVVDGNNGFTNSDREMILFLKAEKPKIRVLFVINKIDYNPQTCQLDCASTDSEDDDDDYRFHKIGQLDENKKCDTVIHALKKYDLLEADSEDYSLACPLSILRIRQQLRNPDKIDLINKQNAKYQEYFDNLEKNIQSVFTHCSKSVIQQAVVCQFIISMRMFNLFTNSVKDATEFTPEENKVARSKGNIKELFEEIIAKLKQCKGQFTEKLKNLVQDPGNKFNLKNELKSFRYAPLKLEHKVRKNEVEFQCQRQVANMLTHNLNVLISNNIASLCDSIKTQLKESVQRLKAAFASEQQDLPAGPWKNLIISKTQEIIDEIVNLDFSIQVQCTGGFLSNAKEACKRKYKQMKKIFTNENEYELTDKVGSADWTAKYGLDYIDGINFESECKHIFSKLEKRLQESKECLLSLLVTEKKYCKLVQGMIKKKDADIIDASRNSYQSLLLSEALKTSNEIGKIYIKDNEMCTHTRVGRQYAIPKDYKYDEWVFREEDQFSATVMDERATTSTGVLNHYLIKSDILRASCQHTVITRMITLNQNYEVCILHRTYTCSLVDFIEKPYTRAEAYHIVYNACELAEFFMASNSTDWSLEYQYLLIQQNNSKCQLAMNLIEFPAKRLKFTKQKNVNIEAHNMMQSMNILQLATILLMKQIYPEFLDTIQGILDAEETQQQKTKSIESVLKEMWTVASRSSINQKYCVYKFEHINLSYCFLPSTAAKRIENIKDCASRQINK